MNAANAALEATGRGVQIDLIEMATVGGASDQDLSNAWVMRPVTDRGDLENAATENKGRFKFRDNAVNVYITQSFTTGESGITLDFDDDDEIIFLGQGAFSMTLLHESGHFFGLYHTQARYCGNCGGKFPGCDEG